MKLFQIILRQTFGRWSLLLLAVLLVSGMAACDLAIAKRIPAQLFARDTPESAAQDTQLEGQALVDELKKGGYVIYFRHAATDQSKRDSRRLDLGNCKTQRNLSKKGRSDASAIGQAFNKLQIPIVRVLASPYCRAMDTARLAFNRVEMTNALIEEQPQNEAKGRVAEARLRPLLATVPESGMNNVLVSHRFNLRALAGFDLAEGEAAIYKPDGEGGFRLVARLLPDKWNALSP